MRERMPKNGATELAPKQSAAAVGYADQAHVDR